MSITVGIDIGTVSVKGAIVGDPDDRPHLQRLVRGRRFFVPAGPTTAPPVALSPDPRQSRGCCAGDPCRHPGRRPRSSRPIASSLTGSGARLLQAHEAIERVNDFKALAAAIAFLHPEVATVFEMGGESSRFLRLAGDPVTGQPAILDYETNGDCAAGTGAFMDQQAHRLRYRVEEVGGIACTAPSAARIAGRCSVFAKSDMIHAQQKGATPPQILRGLCDAVARNFKGSITKGKPVVPPVAFVGGLARNAGIVQSLRELYKLDESQLLVPEAAPWFGAIGAALLCARSAPNGDPRALESDAPLRRRPTGRGPTARRPDP